MTDLFDVANLPSGLDKLHLTFVSPEGTSTFARDNAGELRVWWAVQCAKLRNPDRADFWSC